jgi:Xaa-Pro aminopeptidase
MILHSHWAYIEQEFGCGLRDRFLMPVRSFDNAKSVSPFILEAGERRTGLFVHVEHGNAKAALLPPSLDQAFYRPYFTFGPPASADFAHATLADAILALSHDDRTLQLDQDLPVGVGVELARTFDVSHERSSDAGPVTLKRISITRAAEALASRRPAARIAARQLLERSPVRDLITPYLDRPDRDRFAALDSLLSAATVEALVLTTRLNMQEVAGVPMRAKRPPVAAFYLPGGTAFVIEPGSANDGKAFPTIRSALEEICPKGRIACEMDDIGLGLFAELGLEERDTNPADMLLRRWRDNGTLADLAFYIVATRASRTATDAALGFAERAVHAGDAITEMDAYRIYHQTLHATVAETMPELRVGRTLTNFHTGARTIFPANVDSAPVTAHANTLKLDTGCLLFDPNGTLLGCSDIARTLAFSDEGREMYELFQNGVRHRLVPACAVGATGAAIHAAGVNAIWNEGKKPCNNSLFVDLPDPVAGYDRDVGHLLGKNNLAHLTFVSRSQDKLSEGMIACCEYQWPIAGHAIAYEDTCLVTPSGGLNLTSDEL